MVSLKFPINLDRSFQKYLTRYYCFPRSPKVPRGHIVKTIRILLTLLAVFVPALVLSQYSYPNRRAVVADVCPHLKITSFTFQTVYERSMDRFKSNYSWKNVGSQGIESFELIILKYDPFNDQLIGSKAIFPGHNSAKYSPLMPGEEDSDGGSNINSDAVYTAVAYIRSIRFTNGTIWRAAASDIVKSIRAQVPDLLDVGKLVPQEDKKKDGLN